MNALRTDAKESNRSNDRILHFQQRRAIAMKHALMLTVVKRVLREFTRIKIPPKLPRVVLVAALMNLAVLGQEKTVGSWVEQLKSKDPAVRQKAAKALGDSKNAEAVQPLISALADKNEDVRSSAAEALGKLRDARAVEPLIAALKEQGYVQHVATGALGNIGAPAVDPLIIALENKNASIRQGAAEALKQIKEPAEERLIAALKHQNPYVRQGAADALGDMNTRPGAEALDASLKAKDLAVIAGAYAFYLSRDEHVSSALLISALNAYGNQEMAEYLLDSDNRQLAGAARSWAARHGCRYVQYLTTSGLQRGLDCTHRTRTKRSK